MFQIGDKVTVEPSAQVDVGYLAWQYIHTHPVATVKHIFVESGVAVRDTIIALEWDEPFPGGWDVYEICLPRRGQQITSKHLTLNFEESRQAVTVPRFEGWHE